MSLHPTNAYCTRCGGTIPMGQFGRNLKSACRCNPETELSWDTFKKFRDADPEIGDPMLKPRKAA